MIKVRLFLIFVLILALSCVRESGFKLRGTVEGSEAEMIYLDEQGVTKIIPVDSARIKKDRESAYTGKIIFTRSAIK